ncbi:MAG: DNA mismatch repair protein MutS [Flavobacteriales bacterium]|nr:DNA mismatch repair protein MutS [Flavobacteriales bacterium]
MNQYFSIKKKYPDSVLLFRVGDFYEMFGDDAVEASKILGIILTNRANGSSKIELAGFPYHSLNTYLPKLVKAGKRIAICEQLEDPKKTKKIVKRGVTELITPGLALNDEVLEGKKNNFLASVFFGNKSGVSFLDISTGEYLIAEGPIHFVSKLINSFSPSEILFSKTDKNIIKDKFSDSFYFYPLEDWIYKKEYCLEKLLNQFEVKSLKGLGIEHMYEGIIAAGAILHYLSLNKHDKLNHITSIKRLDEQDYVWMDRFTIRNLELIYPSNEGGVSLLNVIDQTCTSMGSRMIRNWILFPLKNIVRIKERVNIVDFFIKNEDVLREAKIILNDIGDIDRMIAKISTVRITPRELNKFKQSLILSNNLKNTLISKTKSSVIRELFENYDSLQSLIDSLEKTLRKDAPVQLYKGQTINDGVNQELYSYRQLAISSEKILEDIRQREIKRTSIPSLKISYNNVFGYYLEVRNTHKHKVPADWIRKQTLVSAERYITEELKELEVKIINAKEHIHLLEAKIYHNLVSSILPSITKIQSKSELIAKLDCLTSFASTALNYNYTKPIVKQDYKIDIKQGRHPVIESQLENKNDYIPNDIYLDDTSQQLIMITGPNMSGKSAILRQTAIIVLMSQIGSFIPAYSAKIGLVDKIFTRVGASDNISKGESTFMVEMNETASILNNLSSRSLVLLDEIGRGTSTFDGISIAWSIAEYLHEVLEKPKTLFATHYHELNKMSDQFKRIRNYNVSVKEINNEIVFLRKLEKGGVEHSFGIHVARMAGMPKPLLKRAKEILLNLESSRNSVKINNSKDHYQLSFIQLEDPILDEIKKELMGIDIDNLTPLEALMKLNQIKRKIGIQESK